MKKILLVSAWQDVNIGDIAYTPGMLHVLENYIPDAEITLWPWHPLTDEVKKLLTGRFPNLKIVNGDVNSDGTNITRAKNIARFLSTHRKSENDVNSYFPQSSRLNDNKMNLYNVHKKYI